MVITLAPWHVFVDTATDLKHATFEVAATFEDRRSPGRYNKAIGEYLVLEIIGVDCLAKL